MEKLDFFAVHPVEGEDHGDDVAGLDFFLTAAVHRQFEEELPGLIGSERRHGAGQCQHHCQN